MNCYKGTTWSEPPRNCYFLLLFFIYVICSPTSFSGPIVTFTELHCTALCFLCLICSKLFVSKYKIIKLTINWGRDYFDNIDNKFLNELQKKVFYKYIFYNIRTNEQNVCMKMSFIIFLICKITFFFLKRRK